MGSLLEASTDWKHMCSDSLEEEGEVPGAANVPHHVVEEADCVQNLSWSK